MEGLEGDDQTGRRAVRDRRDVAAPTAPLALQIEKPRVVPVHSRNQDRHVVIVAERRSGADDGSLARVAGLELSRHVGLDGREDQVDAVRFERGAVFDLEIEQGGRRLHLAPPAPRARLGVAQRLAIALAGGALRAHQPRDVEPRMTGERRHELLPGDAGGTDQRDLLLRGHEAVYLREVLRATQERGDEPIARCSACVAGARTRRCSGLPVEMRTGTPLFFCSASSRRSASIKPSQPLARRRTFASAE